MISFRILGAYGRFGNQLFQYAFLRTTASRLGVSFYCPPWLGDTIFQLDDGDERACEQPNLKKSYVQPADNPGFSPSALNIEDGTEITGFFQSERYFDSKQVRQWFTFREEAIAGVCRKYADIDFKACAGVHLRFGDMNNHPQYALPTPSYYRRAIKKIRPGSLVVFSDNIEMARRYLDGIDGRECFYIEGNRSFEDLYLMTLCRDFICSISTFSWWGAWLGQKEDSVIVCPQSWLRPGQPVCNDDLSCRSWLALRSCRFLRDHYYVFKAEKILRKVWQKAKQRSVFGNLKSFGNCLRNYIRRAVRLKSASPQIKTMNKREESKLYFGRRLKRMDAHEIIEDDGELRLFMATRNSVLRLPYLFKYYRSQGVDRFFVTDNGSTDGTSEFLASQSDVHVFRTEDSYAKAECGILWVEYLMDLYGRNRWCLVVDDDEIFFYPHTENLSLKDFCDYLDAWGSTAVHSLLLDMYSDKPVDETLYQPGESFVETCPFFETGNRERRGDGLDEGGMRLRVFGTRNILSKHNLIKWVPGIKLGGGTHFLDGARLSAVKGATLHFKYFHDFTERVIAEAKRGEHWMDSLQYRAYAEVMTKQPRVMLYYSDSIRFRSSRQLVELGLMHSTEHFEDFVTGRIQK